MTAPDPRRLIPRTDAVLAEPALLQASARLGRGVVKALVVQAQAEVRAGRLDAADVAARVLAALPDTASGLQPVLNATGVVLHTNLGRAPLSAAASAAVGAASAYVDVEYDTETGHRAARGRSVLAALRVAVPAAEAVLVVNNGAAALVLATTALAAGRSITISRGEMVEIGDGFRLPDLIESTGAQLREVGTTNRVTPADYASATDTSTAAILKIHPSNFRIEGFTQAVSVARLAELGPPVIVDIGSGLLRADPLLPDEPDVASALAAGAGLVTCSGDKLLGGPQAGLIFGRAELVERLRRHPLARALRVDKLTLAALEATLRGPSVPTYRYLHADASSLRARCQRLADAIAGGQVVPSKGAVGGGSAPGVALSGWAVAVPAPLAERLRRGRPSVIGRIEHDRCLLDLRCIEESDDPVVLAAILAALD